MALVLHRNVQRANSFGGTTFSTLCGRMNARCSDGMNIAATRAEVTCKFCLKLMAELGSYNVGGTAHREAGDAGEVAFAHVRHARGPEDAKRQAKALIMMRGFHSFDPEGAQCVTANRRK